MDPSQLREDAIFKALADPTRRRIIELVEGGQGITIHELCTHFPVSRFAVMKHLNILEDVGIVRREREGASKRLFFDPGPLREVHEAWLGRFVSQQHQS